MTESEYECICRTATVFETEHRRKAINAKFKVTAQTPPTAARIAREVLPLERWIKGEIHAVSIKII